MVAFGLAVALVSMYQASMRGVYLKMGFDDSSYATEVDKEGYMEVYEELSSRYGECRYGKHIVSSIMTRFAEQSAVLDMTLAENNLVCGVMMVTRGSVKRGMFDLVKSQRYSVEALDKVGEECEHNAEICEDIAERVVMIDSVIDRLYRLSSGRVRDAIGDIVTP